MTRRRLEPRDWTLLRRQVDLGRWSPDLDPEKRAAWLTAAWEWYFSSDTLSTLKKLGQAAPGSWQAEIFPHVLQHVRKELRSDVGPQVWLGKTGLVWTYDEVNSEWQTQQARPGAWSDPIASFPDDVPHGHRRYAADLCTCLTCRAGRAMEARLKGLRGRPSPKLEQAWRDAVLRGVV